MSDAAEITRKSFRQLTPINILILSKKQKVTQLRMITSCLIAELLCGGNQEKKFKEKILCDELNQDDSLLSHWVHFLFVYKRETSDCWGLMQQKSWEQVSDNQQFGKFLSYSYT